MLETIKQSVRTSIIGLLSNKMRSFLTMLGIIIGVGSVIVIIAVGAGAQSLIVAQIKSLGSNLVGVLPGKAEESGPPISAMGITITTLTYDDAMALKNKANVPNVVNVVAFSNGEASLKWQNNSLSGNLNGCTASYLEVEGGEVDKGRFFTKEEERNLARVIVLGSGVKEDLFGDSEAVGQRIKVKNISFEVIGVMKERGTVAFQDYDNKVFLPIKTMQKLIAGVNYIGVIRLKIDREENVNQAIEDIKITLRERHDIKDMSGKDDDFTVRSMVQALDIITTITNSLKYFLAAMAALSLLVGGIGIMNIMLVSVTERTREIGLRKAIGATNFRIMLQFLFEAMVITALGGVIGIIGGIIIAYIISVGANLLGYDWEFSISMLSIILAFGVSAAIGLVFGIFPARKASRLEPVEALRYE